MPRHRYNPDADHWVIAGSPQHKIELVNGWRQIGREGHWVWLSKWKPVAPAPTDSVVLSEGYRSL